MKTLSKSFKIITLLTGIYGALYFWGFIVPFFTGELSFFIPNDRLVFLLFVLFWAGYLCSFWYKKLAGMVYMVWYAGVFILSTILDKSDGMPIVLGFPMVVIGAFLYLEGCKEEARTKMTEQQEWHIILRVLLINYAVNYLIYMYQDLVFSAPLNLWAFPGLVFPVLLAIFLMGFALSWKSEVLAGIFFILWYLIALAVSVGYTDIFNRGPMIMVGLTLLMQGIFYIRNHYKFKLKDPVIPKPV
ncbi:MAG: hypothetical protein AB7U05_13720 [Mangrovibacterium sp.]